MNEAEHVVERYSRRKGNDPRYSMLKASVWQGVQERQRAIIKLLVQQIDAPISELSVLEIGAGSGINMLELIGMGFSPAKISANELLADRITTLCQNLPSTCSVLKGDATQLVLAKDSISIIYQSTVFSSLLDDTFQEKLSSKMWNWLQPGGGIIWYDFIYNNPKNPDVRGVPIKRIRELFPQADITIKRVTLAPPISRLVCPLHPSLYHVFNIFPLLRTHVLCWIGKPKNVI